MEFDYTDWPHWVFVAWVALLLLCYAVAIIDKWEMKRRDRRNTDLRIAMRDRFPRDIDKHRRIVWREERVKKKPRPR